MTKPAQWMRLPLELRQRQQWLLAAPNDKGDLKVPMSVNAHGELLPGSSTARETWLTFDHACAVAAQRGLGIGYVLAFDDPFCCIDLDVKNNVNAPNEPQKWTSAAQIELYTQIMTVFDSYTERSQSGIGLHIWCLGKIGTGCKRDGVELYSQERFIACTGDVWLDRPVRDRQEWVSNMASQMRATMAPRAEELVDLPETLTDAEVWERAANAANADKFLALCRGEWAESGEYPSQSEADLALMSMFTFYSQSNEQCRRMFRMTMLGKREKAVKNDRYLNYTLSLIRARQAREAKVMEAAVVGSQGLIDKVRQADLARAEVARLQGAQPLPPHPPAPAYSEPTPQSFHVPPGTDRVSPDLLPAPPASPAAAGNELDWPPGLAGAIAGFVYRNAVRPVKEVGIVAALGWLAGVCGKAYMITGSGLNLYVILVARSAVGKEAMHSGLSVLTQSLLNTGYVTASRVIDYSDFASGPALRKAVAANPSFLNVSGEWGRKLRRLGADGVADGPMQSLRTEMTNLYQKSGPASIVGGMTYSKKEDSVASISGVNYSMIGETTPDTFYNALTETMMEDGFLSRFNIVEYNGPRPPTNGNVQHTPEPELIQACGAVLVRSAKLVDAHKQVQVPFSEAAKRLADEFDRQCDSQINLTIDESWRQMWNRAHLKALRVAALLAVADNCLEPLILESHMRWALELVRRDIAVMKRKIDDGEIGTGDSTRERKILALCKAFIEKLPHGYQIPDTMHAQGIVPRKYFQIRTQRTAIFSQARNGGIRALDETLRSLCDSGYLLEMDKAKTVEAYGFQGRCYRIVNLPNGLLE